MTDSLWCDDCAEDMEHGWLVGTGEWDEEFNAPVCEAICDDCYKARGLS